MASRPAPRFKPDVSDAVLPISFTFTPAPLALHRAENEPFHQHLRDSRTRDADAFTPTSEAGRPIPFATHLREVNTTHRRAQEVAKTQAIPATHAHDSFSALSSVERAGSGVVFQAAAPSLPKVGDVTPVAEARRVDALVIAYHAALPFTRGGVLDVVG